MNNILNEELGNALTAKEVAKYLGLDAKTVRLYAPILGGVKVGKKYIFFERRIADAILQQEQEQMGGAGNETGAEDFRDVPHKKRGQGVRGHVSEITNRELEAKVRADLERVGVQISPVL